MKFRILLSAIGLIYLSGSLGVNANDSVQSGLDTFVHTAQIRIAFYEEPPSSQLKSMQGAVKRFCRDSLGHDLKPEWLCKDEQIHFIRGVNVLGTRYEAGYVCEGRSSLKYNSSDMYGESDCIFIYYDSKRKNHYVQLNPKAPEKP